MWLSILKRLVYFFFFRSKDEDFYSNLAATAEDDLSDVSEADVNQMARSLAVSAESFMNTFTKSDLLLNVHFSL